MTDHHLHVVGVAAAQKKFGGQYGMGDPNKTKGTNEKIVSAVPALTQARLSLQRLTPRSSSDRRHPESD